MGARRGIDLETILLTAEAMVDVDGWEPLNMTRLAAKLGVRGPSLYHHVESWEDLLARLQVRALRALSEDIGQAALGRVRADGLRATALALRAFAFNHPGRYDLAMREAIDRDSMIVAGAPAGEALTGLIRSFGVTDDSMELQLACLAPLHGVLVLDQARQWAGDADSDAVYQRTVDMIILMLEQVGQKQRAPSGKRDPRPRRAPVRRK